MQKSVATMSPVRESTISHSTGFTLIELMVVLAIMGILTMVAYPGYQESMRKTRRADAITAALNIQVAQEKFRASCAVYASAFVTTANTCTPLTTPPVYAIKGSSDTPEDYYTMSLSGVTGNAYVITATAKGAQLKDTDCLTMTITFNNANPNGLKQPAICWP